MSFSNDSEDSREGSSDRFRRKLEASANFKHNFPSVNDEPDEQQNMNLSHVNSLMKSLSQVQDSFHDYTWVDVNFLSGVDESELH